MNYLRLKSGLGPRKAFNPMPITATMSAIRSFIVVSMFTSGFVYAQNSPLALSAEFDGEMDRIDLYYISNCELDRALSSIDSIIFIAVTPVQKASIMSLKAEILFALGEWDKGIELFRAALSIADGWDARDKEKATSRFRNLEKIYMDKSIRQEPYSYPCLAYPKHLVYSLLSGKGGFVEAELAIHPSGLVQGVRIISSPTAVLEEAALFAMRHWRYRKLNNYEDQSIRTIRESITFEGQIPPAFK